LTNGTAFAILLLTGERAPDLVTVKFLPRDLLGSSSELPLGFALRAQIQPVVYLHTRAFLS